MSQNSTITDNIDYLPIIILLLIWEKFNDVGYKSYHQVLNEKIKRREKQKSHKHRVKKAVQMQSPKSVFFACENSFCIEYQMVRNVIIGGGFFACSRKGVRRD